MEGGEQEQSIVGLWDPSQTLRRVSSRELDYSRGFSRCQFGQWFPGLGLQWLTLTHTLGVEVKILGVEPLLSVPSALDLCFVGQLADEEIGVAADRQSLIALMEACIPGGRDLAQGVVIEYLARRFLTSLMLAWGGPQTSNFMFQGVKQIGELSAVGAVVLKMSLSGIQCSVVVLLGQKTVDYLDGIWRRQVRSSAGKMKAPGEISIELAQLAVKPSSILDYTRSGTVVDLEVPVSDNVTLRFPEGGSLLAKLRRADQEFVLESAAGAPPNFVLPEGTTRLSIQLGTARIDSSFELSEFVQPGAMLKTDIIISNNASLVVNNEKVAQAKLCLYENRFAISVG